MARSQPQVELSQVLPTESASSVFRPARSLCGICFGQAEAVTDAKKPNKTVMPIPMAAEFGLYS
jgi:hypothetical protein